MFKKLENIWMPVISLFPNNIINAHSENLNENRAEITQTANESPITLGDVIDAPVTEVSQPSNR